MDEKITSKIGLWLAGTVAAIILGYMAYNNAQPLNVETAYAAAPTLASSSVNYITKSSGMIMSQWSEAPSSVKILFGTSTAYGKYVNVGPNGGAFAASTTVWFWPITGLASNTLIHYCPQATDGLGNFSVCDGVSNDFTFTTGPDVTPGVVDAPIAPQVNVVATPPTQTGATLNVASDCSDFQAKITSSTPGDTIVIPKGTICTGKYTFPNKASSTAWVVIKSSGNYPAYGNRASSSDVSEMATIRTNNIWIPQATYAEVVATSTRCIPGFMRQLFPATTTAPGIFGCAYNGAYASSSYEAIAYTSGTSVPGSCTIGTLFWKTNEPDTNLDTYMCTNDRGTQRFVQLDTSYTGVSGPTAAIQMAAGANHYRFEGIELTNIQAPANWSGNISPGLRFYTFGAYHPVNYTGATVTDIIYDRMYVHSYVYPNITDGAFEFNGSRNAIVNSTIRDITFGSPLDYGIDTESTAVVIFDNSTGGLFQNNSVIDVIGISFFVPDDYTTNNATDWSVIGNYWLRTSAYKYPTADGLYYFMRHHFELKHGSRWLISGNIFDGNYSTINQGALIAISSRGGFGLNYNNPATIGDINFTNNIMRNAPAGFANLSFNTYSGTQIKILQRLAITNNLSYNIISGPTFESNTCCGASGAWQIFINGVEDFTAEHNTNYFTNTGPFISFYSGPLVDPSVYDPGAYASIKNNIFVSSSTATTAFVYDGTSQGQQAIRSTYGVYPFASTTSFAWTYTNNVLVNINAQSANYPANNFFAAATSTVDWIAYGTTNGALATSSPYKFQATDGTDPGVNTTTLAAATNNTLNGQTVTSSSSGGTRSILGGVFKILGGILIIK